MAAQLLQMLTSLFVARCITSIAELGIADLLADEAKTAEELARHSSADPEKLLRMLCALQSVGMLAQRDDGAFLLTPIGQCLRSDVEGSLRAAAAFMGHHRTWSAWGQLTHSVGQSASGFETATGMSLFKYLAEDAEYRTLFNDAMRDLAARSYPAVLTAYDFSSAGKIVDVGGGTGTLLALILKNNPQLSGILFDLPQVIAQADPILKAHEVESRCIKIEGDFFRSVPANADTYLLATVIHDWNDEGALTILRNCRRVMSEGQRLLLLETLIPDKGANYANVLDMEMLVLTSGRERTIADYERLFRDSGFELKRVIPTDSHLYIIEGLPG